MLMKEVICLEEILEHVDTEKMVEAFQEGMKLSNERIKNANKITFVKELMDEVV